MKIFKEKKYSILSNILKYSGIVIFVFALVSSFLFVNADNSITTKIVNPLGDGGPQNIPDFIKAAIDIVLIVGVPIIVLAIIYSGFLFVKAQGKPEDLKTAKNTLLYTLIGAALLLGAYVIANAIGKTIEDIKAGA